jgi:hypothetical protein
MKDLDVDRLARHKEREAAMGDRQFKFGGEVFTYRANVRYDVLRDVAAMTADTDGSEVIDTLERTVLDLLESDKKGHERFLKACHQADDPITFQDLNNLATWLIQEQVQSPTLASLPSGAGDATTSTDSTESLSLPLAEAAAV